MLLLQKQQLLIGERELFPKRSFFLPHLSLQIFKRLFCIRHVLPCQLLGPCIYGLILGQDPLNRLIVLSERIQARLLDLKLLLKMMNILEKFKLPLLIQCYKPGRLQLL